MRAVIQRVKRSAVIIEGKSHSQIGKGLLVLLGIEEADGVDDLVWLSAKIVNLRIFDDARGVMNISVRDSGGDILVVSQFTLYASTKKGNRPSYVRAAKPDVAIPLYEQFLLQVQKDLGKQVYAGVFQAMMEVDLINDGPVTIIMDSRNRE
jgi:D-tyrosyl-tRNA(Tyr) deacylase